jgi:hypothetical protein
MIAFQSGKGRQLRSACVFLVFVFAFASCSQRQSLVQQRLHEWLPTSAKEVISKSSGQSDDTTFITFVCSPSDLWRLREKFSREDNGVWKHLPLDRRTSDILKLALDAFKISEQVQPRLNSSTLEYLNLPESIPYGPVGSAVLVDPEQNRFWYIESTM